MEPKTSLTVVLGGVRGSRPVADPRFMTYGGETTAFRVQAADGSSLLIDAGSGLRLLADAYSSDQGPVRLLLTHFHLDHLNGLPSFRPLYDGGRAFEIIGPHLGVHTPADAVRALISRPYWPFDRDDYPARISFEELPSDANAEIRKDGWVIRWCPLHHDGGCVAYRVLDECSGRSVVFATDVEWGAASDEEQEALLLLCREAGPPDLLVFDGQIPVDEVRKFEGWGHSTWRDGVDLARAVGAEQLIITHHSPDFDDERLAQMEKNLQAEWPEARFGRCGMRIEL